ncbi:VOC family protein [Halorussus lipolyticus]|uniref:VOC family protein n=1 Tax=Halorussus lipolyticus TaxID=3034024 RepID=UPI0023E7D93F|nr:VOC family protein [Halorussus sp. DT80]
MDSETPETYPTELGHVHLKVRDVDRAVEFYRDVLGLDVTERVGNYVFLTFGSEARSASDEASGEGRPASSDHHHDLALQGVGGDAPEPGPGVGLYHAAFEVESPEDLRATYRRLRERGVEVSAVDHHISKALYFDDPDGNGLEVYLDTREENDRPEWGGENARFDPESLAE